MANQNLFESQFGSESYRDTRDWAQSLLLALRESAGMSLHLANENAAGVPAHLLGGSYPESGRLRISPIRDAGSDASSNLVDPNFRQLSRVSPSQSRYIGAGKDLRPPTPAENTFGSNGGRPSETVPLEDGVANTGQTPVEAGFGQLVRPRPFPQFGPAGPMPKPQFPDWWPTLEDLLRIYPMVRYGRVRRGNNDEDCVERHEKEENRCFQRYGQGEYAHPHFLDACKERASNRRNLCVANGGKPRADEPKEWSLKDEEVYRNLDR